MIEKKALKVYDKYMLKWILLYIEETEYNYYTKILAKEAARAGISFKTISNPREAEEIRTKTGVAGDAYLYNEGLIITDNQACVEYAKDNNIAFLVYEIPYDESEKKELREKIVSDGAICIIQGFEEVDLEFLNHMYERYHHIPWKICETKRLIIREITTDDVPGLYEIYKEPAITAYMEGLYEPIEEEIAFTKAYIENMYRFFGYGMWILESREDGSIIGRAGLSNRDGYEDLELGYMLAKPCWHKGLAKEACQAIIRYAGLYLGAGRLNCFIVPENEDSIRLCKSLGFMYEESVLLEGKEMDRYTYIFP